MQCNAMQCNAMHCNALHCNAWLPGRTDVATLIGMDMTGLRTALVVALLLLPTLATGATRAAPAALLICFEDVPQRPWTMPDGTGLNFEMMKRVETLLGERFSYTGRPWKRCLEELRLGRVDALMGAADGPERRTYALFPTHQDGAIDTSQAMYSERYNVFLRKGSSAAWDGRRLRTRENAVLVQAGYLVASYARERGLQAVERAKSSEDALRMVAEGMFDAAILYGDESLLIAREDARFRERVVHAPGPFWVSDFYLMTSTHAYQRDPARIKAIWQAVATVRQSAEYQKLVGRAVQ